MLNFGFSNMLNNQWPNLAAYQSLGNRYWISNFGGAGVGAPQHNIYPDGYSPLVYSLAQGFAQPNSIMQWNPMLIGMDLTKSLTTNPMMTMQGNMAAYNWGYTMAITSKLQGKLSSLTGIESQLTSILKSDKLDGAQKQRLQGVLDDVKALKEKVQKLIENNERKPEDIEAIQGEISEVVDNASKVAQEVLKEVKETSEAEQADGQNSDATAADDADDATGAADDTTEGAGAAATEEAKKKQQEKENLAVDICQDMYDGSVGNRWGTDYDKIKKGINRISKDNVTTVLNTWQSQYQPITGDANLIETLFNEEHLYNPSLNKNHKVGCKIANPSNNMDMIWNIVACLDQRAKDLGIKNKLAGLFAVCYDELDDFNVDQDAIINSVQKINEAVTKAEAQQSKKDIATEKANEKKAEAANKKAEKDRAEAKKTQELKNEFKNDMREILGDDKAEVSENVKYIDGKFVIRINGKNYYGKDYLELANALEKAGYDPIQYLKQKALNKAA